MLYQFFIIFCSYAIGSVVTFFAVWVLATLIVEYELYFNKAV